MNDKLETLKHSLLNRLQNLSKSYYDGKPEVSDEEYDSIENFYQELIRDEFKPGDIRKNNFRDTAKHWAPMVSVDKTYDINDIQDFYNRFKDVICEPKLDGASISLQYISGVFYKAISSGNGVIGNDITHIIGNYLKIKYPNLLYINNPITFQVRGEFIIPEDHKSHFISLGYKNLRNVISGKINSETFSDDTTFAEFIVHDVFFQGEMNNIVNLNERKRIISDIGFIVVPNINFNLQDTIPMEYKINNLTFLIDGLVFKSINRDFTLTKQGYPIDSFALKSSDRLNIVTSINNIVWNLSNEKVIPRFELVPTIMDNSTITYASAYNYRYVKNLVNKLRQDNLITLVRAGDIVPQIKDIVSYGETGNFIITDDMIPSKCPDCNEDLLMEDVNLICKNINCNAKVKYRINKLIEILDIKNVGPKTIEKLIDTYQCKNIKDILSLTADQWTSIPGLGENIYKNSISSINEGLSKFGIDELLVSLCIPFHGNETIKLFRQLWKTDNIEDLLLLESNIINLKYYSKYKWDIFISHINNHKDTINSLKELIRKKYIDIKSNEYIKIMVTGKHPVLPRKSLEAKLLSSGYEISSNISNCEFIVTDDINTNSSKMKKAKSHNIPIKTYEELDGLLK